jgi:hypothetical protein
VAYTYTVDLAKNIAYTRQGNPANANLDMGNDGILQTIDLFLGRKAALHGLTG